MSPHIQFKKIVDEILKSIKKDGHVITKEEIADSIPMSREHFSKLYNGKYPVNGKHIKDLLFRYPEVKDVISQNHLEEENVTYTSNAQKGNKGNSAKQPDDLSKLVDSVWKLSDSCLINSRNIENLIQMKGISYDGSRQNFLVSDPSFPKLVDLLWELARKSGKWEENQFRALVAKLFEREAVPQA